MHGREVDVAIVGGGLAGGLIALALFRQRPDLSIALFEQGDVLGGNHRWSWFESDLDEAGRELLEAFPRTEWHKGYDVRFPKYLRTLSSGYLSLSSADYHANLMEVLPENCVRLGSKAETLDAQSVTLDNGERITAKTVIDCRPFEPSPHLQGGWQIFHGQHFRLDQPHGIDRPMIMDADVEQSAPYGNGGAYRFVYVLPLAEDELFIEDTYYADKPRIERDVLAGRIKAYASQHGWDGQLLGDETGLLPVITGGDFEAYQDSLRIPGVAVAGARGGFSHPLTSYTVPIAVENALAIAAEVDAQIFGEITGQADLSSTRLADFCEARAQAHWHQTNIYRMLGRMLFGAAQPHRRVDIFQRFYGLREPLIERFYSTHSTWADKFRILCGKPPVSIPRALGALAGEGEPLTSEKHK
ncbi:MAG: lycopene beta-cyclase CrtY [Erythrobacter sp.]